MIDVEVRAGARDDSEHPFETWARGLVQFLARVVMLPIVLMLTKPRDLVRATVDGQYHPLPTPFLLALSAGVVVSGVVSATITSFNVFAENPAKWADLIQTFGADLGDFYVQHAEGMLGVLYSIPYIIVLWLIAGVASFAMLRGVRNAEAIFAALSLCLAALIEVYAVLFALIMFTPVEIPFIGLIIGFGVLVYALILAVKLIRVVFVLRSEQQSSLAGAIVASVPCLLLIFLVGVLGAVAMSSVAYAQQQDIITKKTTDAEIAAPDPTAAPSMGAAPAAVSAPTTKGQQPAPAN